MASCTSCGSYIPDNQGSGSCSMCYGDIDHGKDGYYRAMLEREAEEQAHQRYQEQQKREGDKLMSSERELLEAELATHGKTCKCAHKKMCEDREDRLRAQIASLEPAVSSEPPAPERVFLRACHPDSPNQNCSWTVDQNREGSIEYIRADLHFSTEEIQRVIMAPANAAWFSAALAEYARARADVHEPIVEEALRRLREKYPKHYLSCRTEGRIVLGMGFVVQNIEQVSKIRIVSASQLDASIPQEFEGATLSEALSAALKEKA